MKSDGPSDCSLDPAAPDHGARCDKGLFPMSKQYRLLIGGGGVEGAGGTYPIINPATEQGGGGGPGGSVQQAIDAARAAQEAFPAWSRTPAAERARLLGLVAEKLAQRQADFVPLIIAETGATAQVGSRMQVPVAIERFQRYAASAGRSI